MGRHSLRFLQVPTLWRKRWRVSIFKLLVLTCVQNATFFRVWCFCLARYCPSVQRRAERLYSSSSGVAMLCCALVTRYRWMQNSFSTCAWGSMCFPRILQAHSDAIFFLASKSTFSHGVSCDLWSRTTHPNQLAGLPDQHVIDTNSIISTPVCFVLCCPPHTAFCSVTYPTLQGQIESYVFSTNTMLPLGWQPDFLNSASDWLFRPRDDSFTGSSGSSEQSSRFIQTNDSKLTQNIKIINKDVGWVKNHL